MLLCSMKKFGFANAVFKTKTDKVAYQNENLCIRLFLAYSTNNQEVKLFYLKQQEWIIAHVDSEVTV